MRKTRAKLAGLLHSLADAVGGIESQAERENRTQALEVQWSDRVLLRVQGFDAQSLGAIVSLNLEPKWFRLAGQLARPHRGQPVLGPYADGFPTLCFPRWHSRSLMAGNSVPA